MIVLAVVLAVVLVMLVVVVLILVREGGSESCQRLSTVQVAVLMFGARNKQRIPGS